MNETGKVVKISGENVTVEFERKASCENCGMCFAGSGQRKMELTLKNNMNAGIGDTVRVESKASGVFKSMLIVYAMPLVAFFIGAVAAHLIFQNDWVTFGTGFVFLAAGFTAVHFVDRKIRRMKAASILPEIVGIEKKGKDDNNIEEKHEKKEE